MLSLTENENESSNAGGTASSSLITTLSIGFFFMHCKLSIENLVRCNIRIVIVKKE